MNQHGCLFFAVLALSVMGCAVGASAVEPETITVAGTEYRVIPDEAFRELGFEFPDIPREENAAYDYIAAINAYEPIEDRDLRMAARKVGGGRTSWDDAPPELREHVERNRETLEHLRAGACKTHCHFPFLERPETDPALSPLIRRTIALGPVRDMAHFLSLAGSMYEHDGDPGRAMELYADAVALGRHVGQNRLLLDVLVAHACLGIGLGNIRQCAVQGVAPPEVLTQTQQRVAGLRAAWLTVPELIQIARVDSTHFSDLFLSELLDVPLRSRSDLLLSGSFLHKVPRWKGPAFAILVEVPAFRESVRRYSREIFEAHQALAQLPAREYLQRRDAVLGAVRRRYLFQIQEALLPFGSTDSLRLVHDRADLSWTVIDAFLALARYRAQHGEYPEKLEDAKDLMLSDGIDPFSGEPLHYRLEPDGAFMIWSVGENLVDNGGAHDENASRWQCADYVWTSRE